MLKNTPESLRIILLTVINYFFQNICFPEDWHDFLIMLIPKNSKNKFRPISLASYTLKLTERIINARLTHFIEKNNYIPDNQNGFRKAKSCSLTIAQLITNLLSNSEENNLIVYDTPCVKCHFYAHLLKQACSKMSLNARSVIK